MNGRVIAVCVPYGTQLAGRKKARMISLSDAEALQAGQYVKCGNCGACVGPSDGLRLTPDGTVLCATCAYPWLTPEGLERMTFTHAEPEDSEDEQARALLTEVFGTNWQRSDDAP